MEHAGDLLLRRYPEYKIMPPPNPAEVALLRITPEIITILDYSKGVWSCRSSQRFGTGSCQRD